MSDDSDEIGAWISRNRRSRTDFPAGGAGDAQFAAWEDAYRRGVEKIMSLPAVKEAGLRLAKKNFVVVSDNGEVSFTERGIHGE